MNQTELREILVQRLAEDLVGPSAHDEIIEDRPTDRYMTGILYPQETPVAPEEDDDFGHASAVEESGQPVAAEEAPPLIATTKPSSAGLSFAVDGTSPTVTVRVQCGTYAAEASEESATKRRWLRTQHDVIIPKLVLSRGAQAVSLSDRGVPGLELYIQISPWEGSKQVVTMALVNRNLRGESRTESEERSFFQVTLEVAPVAGTLLVERPSLRKATDEDGRTAALIYRGAAELATGHTCAADWEMGSDGVRAISTSWLPRAVVHRVSASGADAFAPMTAGNDRLSANLLDTANDSALYETLELLVRCYRTWIAQERNRIPGLPEHFRARAGEHLNECELGASRMAASIELIRRDADVRTAFRMSQRAMVLQRRWAEGKKNLSWYPFQLGFQLLVLESLADRHHSDRQVMDLLWFPTGGGKTEAYLALTAFILFLRRLRRTGENDGAGVAVIMRYTLRLLTIQQFQRAATMVCACEDIRRRDPENRFGTEPFSIGLWVGNNTTPGTIEQARKGEKSGGAMTHKQLLHCPCCHGPLSWKWGVGSVVECEKSGTSCALREMGSTLPIWTIDEDIYRVAPSLLIGTVDKFAQIVRRAETSIFFARGSRRWPPDLIVQDELHLISGPLGSMTGLYETAIDELCTRDNTSPKIIGSTATIRRAEEQIKALFARNTYQFPAPGIDASSSGFAVTDGKTPGRAYVGISTAGRSAKYVVQAVSAVLLQASSGLQAPVEVRDPYSTLVVYFNTLRELGGSLVLMQDDVPISIKQLAQRHGETARTLAPPAELTSRVGSSDIRNMLVQLETPCGKEGAYDVLLASNMISVGIDIPRLGLMLVVGQPKSIAEYIQATSRVGRRAPGLVVAIYNAGRVRDRAHFETFRTWHDTLYREVEATSVTPFASRAQDKALHAAFVALVRHAVDGMRDDPPRLNAGSKAQAEKIIERIERRIQSCDPDEVPRAGERLRKLLERWYEHDELSCYWNDFDEDKRGLMMSAEQHAASAQSGKQAGRALWATPNSMREVEPSTPFILVSKLVEKNNASE